MQAFPLRLSALVTIAGMLATACTELTPAENTGVFAGRGNDVAAGINRGSTAATGERFATGAPVNTAVNATIRVIAVHQASVRQRQIAEQRARTTYAKLVDQRGGGGTPAVKRTRGAQADRGADTPTSRAVASTTPRRKRIPRYIAVDTVKENEAPGTAKAVMIWDTQAQEIVGNNVYDVSSTPPVGSMGRFETFSAEYVGAGL